MLEARTDAEDLPEPRLSFGAWLSIYAHGGPAPKCGWCGKFRRESDFYGAPTRAVGPNISVTFSPACKACRKEAAE